MFFLPIEVLSLIYSFDPTYHIKNKKVLKQIIGFGVYHNHICNSGVYNVFEKICKRCMEQQNINRELKPFKKIINDFNLVVFE